MRQALLGALALLVPGAALAAPAVCPALPPRQPMPYAATPAALAYAAWQPQIDALTANLPNLQRESRQLVFVGDSLTAGWDPGVFGQYYGLRSPLLLGVVGDATPGVLERLPSEWGTLHPKLVMLLIGTNNTQWLPGSPEDVALGIAEIVRMIHVKSPTTRILILGILPRGATPAEPLRAVNAKVNALIAKCADGKTVFYADPGPALLDAQGNLSNEMSTDMLHLTAKGYATLAAAMEPEIKTLMGD